ncbi:MAG: outer membrane beta-barrel protein [Gemmatimonadaceae bacterium]
MRALLTIAVTVGTGLLAGPAHAQMLGVPVLQNAFYNPGITVAANYGTGDHISAYGGAAAWAPGSGRLVLSGGAGAYKPSGGSSQFTWGGRLSLPIYQLMGGSAGVALFGGIGGANASVPTATPECVPALDCFGSSTTRVSVLRVPAGAALGYRAAFAGRGASLYVAPFYGWSRVSVSGGSSANAAQFRVSVGADVAVLPSVGLTVGYETGATAKNGDPGPTGGLFGVGLSYALRR